MNILAWLDVGLVAGWLANEVMHGGGYDRISTIIVGAIGALLGGFLSGVVLGGDFISGTNITPIIVAFLGALVLIAAICMLQRRSRMGWRRGAPAKRHLAKPASESVPVLRNTFRW